MATAFSSVCIVGMGLLGGSLGMAIRRRRLAARVIGVARRRESLEDALRLGAIDSGTLDLRSAIPNAALVVLCTPVVTIQEQLQQIAPLVSPGAVVTDVGSTKAAIVSAGERLLPGRFLGGHPMAGSEQAGIAAANAGLFEGAWWALTPGPAAAPVEPVAELARSLGSRPLVLPPDEHDRIVAATSHLPHVVAAAVAQTVAEAMDSSPDVPRLAAGSYRDVTRVAASAPELWRDICLTNREPLLAALTSLERHLDDLRAALEREDMDAIACFFERGRAAKERVEGARE